MCIGTEIYYSQYFASISAMGRCYDGFSLRFSRQCITLLEQIPSGSITQQMFQTQCTCKTSWVNKPGQVPIKHPHWQRGLHCCMREEQCFCFWMRCGKGVFNLYQKDNCRPWKSYCIKRSEKCAQDYQTWSPHWVYHSGWIKWRAYGKRCCDIESRYKKLTKPFIF